MARLRPSGYGAAGSAFALWLRPQGYGVVFVGPNQEAEVLGPEPRSLLR